MGGSAIGGDLLKDWSRNRIAVPIEVCREYSLPEYANKNTLVFVVSYSGETEESLSVFLEAHQAQVHGCMHKFRGKLSEFARETESSLVARSFRHASACDTSIFVRASDRADGKMNLAANVSAEISETVENPETRPR